MPSPPWVPVVMFALLGFGCLFIIVNYAGLFGDPENWRLLVGLASILGGIIAATNYR
jgi:multidrug transporter EmrE-like cation transporter